MRRFCEPVISLPCIWCRRSRAPPDPVRRLKCMAGMEESAASYKEQGNLEYKNGHYLKAAAMYTRGLKLEPDNAILLSNRCMALLQINKVTKALADADACIALRPDWHKGHFRRAAALEALGQREQALAAYQRSAEYAPDNQEVASKVRLLTKLMRTNAPAQAGATRSAGAKASSFKF